MLKVFAAGPSECHLEFIEHSQLNLIWVFVDHYVISQIYYLNAGEESTCKMALSQLFCEYVYILFEYIPNKICIKMMELRKNAYISNCTL